MIIDTEWNTVMRAILADCPNQYARSYAQAGIDMTGEARRVQVLYIVANITHWRTPQARAIREYLKGVKS